MSIIACLQQVLIRPSLRPDLNEKKLSIPTANSATGQSGLTLATDFLSRMSNLVNADDGFQIAFAPSGGQSRFFTLRGFHAKPLARLALCHSTDGENSRFSLTAILSLALGIGATVSVFSVIYSAVLNAWPYAGFERACEIHTIDKAGHEGGPSFTGPQVRQLRQVRAVEDVIAMNRWNLVITGSDVPEDLSRGLLYRECVSVFWHAGDSWPLLYALRRA